HELSGGMKQRVLIGISVVLNPRLIIADEPTTGLESRLRDVVLEELMIAKEMDRSSMLLITHDLHAARKTAGRVAIMYAGEIIEIGPSQEILGDPFHPYSRALMGSLPEQGLRPIPGMPPSALSPPEGCRFHPRCPLRKPPCFHEKQKLIRAGTRKVRCVLYA
ncbi:MAG: oligopeptide/dipeptide ABC transporter ATP-binding protein, partial [Candidatus Aminicenantales bacterium]